MTPLEQEAQRQAREFLRLYDPLRLRSNLLLPQRGPMLLGGRHTPGMCMRDDSNVAYDFLDGDFDLDEPVSLAYLNGLMATSGPTQNRTALPEWIRQWQTATGSDAAPGSLDRTWGEFLGSTVGPGNILASAAGAVEGAAVTAKQFSTVADLERAAAQVNARAAAGVQVNPNVRLYDANAVARQKMRARKLTPGKHLMKPRLRIQMTRVPTKVLNAGGMSAKAASGGVRGGIGYSTAAAGRAASVSSAQWAAGNSLRYFKTPGLPAALAFAPTFMIDAADAYEHAADGRGSMNWRKLGVSSAKSQPANVAGFVAGWGAAKGLAIVAGATISTGGVLLIALGVGIAVQWAFNAYGGGEAAGKFADQMLPK